MRTPVGHYAIRIIRAIKPPLVPDDQGVSSPRFRLVSKKGRFLRTSANAFFRDQLPYSTPRPRASIVYRSSAIIPKFYRGELPPRLPPVPFGAVADCLAAKAERACGQRRPATDHGLPKDAELFFRSRSWFKSALWLLDFGPIGIPVGRV